MSISLRTNVEAQHTKHASDPSNEHHRHNRHEHSQAPGTNAKAAQQGHAVDKRVNAPSRFSPRSSTCSMFLPMMRCTSRSSSLTLCRVDWAGAPAPVVLRFIRSLYESVKIAA